MERCTVCGFDLVQGMACPACGSRSDLPSSAAADAETRRAGRGALPLPLAAGAAVLAIAAASYLYLGGPGGPRAAERAAAQRAAAQRALAPVAAPVAAGTPTGAAALRPPAADEPRRAGEKAERRPSRPAYDVTGKLDFLPIDTEERYTAWMRTHTGAEDWYLARKWERSRELLARKDVTLDHILRAFLFTPREFFARKFNLKKAYEDTAIPIGHGQTISGPHMVSHMTESIDPKPDERILEIGTGSGYQAAFLAELSNHVYTIEIVKPLFQETDAIYRRLESTYPEYRNVHRKNADGYYGWGEHAPFQKIVVTAGIDHIPPPLLRQLAPDGIMVIPVGPPSGQTVLKIVKRVGPDGSISFERSDIYHGRKVIFVPFTSTGGGVHSLEEPAAGGKK